MDQYSRGILRGLLAVLVIAVAAVGVSLVVPYPVTFDAMITSLDGSAALITPNREPQTITPNGNDPIPLRIDQTLRLDPGSSAIVTFDLNGGHAVIEGPATLRVVTSERTATTLGHVRATGDYELTIEQEGGSVRYYFDQADPPLEDTQVTIWIENAGSERVVLADPCWLTDVDASGTAISQSFPCP